ncbi:MAG: Dehydrogenase [Gammaproteobacteria bacterium]|nr:Dehydrogenase [Gammaproteobacteria bacterium]
MECSTLSHAWVMTLQQTLAAVGVRFSDCPVTGGPDGARACSLRVLAGADPDTLTGLRPILAAFATEIIHFGPAGSGTCYKLIVNLIGAVQATALAEGLVIAEQAGLDPATVGHALEQSTVASPHVQYLLQRMLAADHDDVYFSAALRHKDAAYALRLAAEHKLQLPTSAAATELFRLALAQGLGQKNSSIIHQVLRDLQAK